MSGRQRKINKDDFEDGITIGVGSFGRVLLVRHTRTNKFFAMKAMAKASIIRLKQIDHTKNEKDILLVAKHPFIVQLFGFDQDEFFVYLYFEYVCGGELFTYLMNDGFFDTLRSVFYTSEIILGLEFLHQNSIVYRDLKPENLLLSSEGHIKITDFGFAKRVTGRTYTLCGTPEYIAPEIIKNEGHSFAVDWWSLGVLIYEFLVGRTPFASENPSQIYENIMSGRILWHSRIDSVAKDLIQNLLVHDKTRRLGNMKNGVNGVKEHKWFANVPWDNLENVEPPYMPPSVSGPGDTRNFQLHEDEDWRSEAIGISDEDQQLFADF